MVFNVRKYDLHCLRVKIKSLAEEARIIRQEEKRAGHPYCHGLRDHRVSVVRFESRATLLAYAHLRGKPSPEKKVRSKWEEARAKSRARQIIKKYGSKLDLEAWDKGMPIQVRTGRYQGDI